MRQKYLYITDESLYANDREKKSYLFLDNKLAECYPEFYEINYDLELLVSPKPTQAEKESPIYNGIYEGIGAEDINAFKVVAQSREFKKVVLRGFRQEHFDYIAPYIKDSTEVLYLSKCPRIKDLRALSEFKNLKCLLIYWNNTLESLWNMENNTELEVLSFVSVSKLKDISDLKNSKVKYITFDSADNSGGRRICLFEDMSVLDNIPHLEHLRLVYKKLYVDY